MRILYIQRGLVPPPANDRMEHFFYLSEAISGDILLPVWWNTPEEVEKELGPGSYPVHQVRNFKYHLFLSGGRIGIWERITNFLFYIRTGLRIHRNEPFDCIVTYGFTMTAFAGIILKWLTGAKLILEINSEPSRAYLFDLGMPMIVRRLVALSAKVFLHFAVWNADHLRVLYPGQMQPFPLLRRVPSVCFHAFVPTSLITPIQEKQKIVLFVGHPWYLKGADVMIKAFRMVAAEFPDVRLLLVGYYPDRPVLEQLIGDCGQIEIRKQIPNAEAVKLIAGSMIVAHPTRTEGMGRVLVEAMAAGVPCVASRVGGIPHYVRHGYNGLLVRPGDAEDLAAKLRTLLSDSAMRARLSANALEFTQERLTEKVYVEGFVTMLNRTVTGESS